MGGMKTTFLALDESKFGPWDFVILPIPLEMTTSYGEGTKMGPKACIDASYQVELFDPILPEDLPNGVKIHTAEPWNSEAPTLRSQLDSITDYVSPWIDKSIFPLILGGEHGILLPIIELIGESMIRDLSKLTLVQIDAHADLRNTLNGEKFSHGTVIRRIYELGIGKVIQIGVRGISREENEFINSHDNIETWFARDLLSLSDDNKWKDMIENIGRLEGNIWLTFDCDGLDGKIVPTTGTSFPGGISYWGAVEIIEKLFESKKRNIIGADINEIVPSEEGTLTEFSAALIATKILSCYTNYTNENSKYT